MIFGALGNGAQPLAFVASRLAQCFHSFSSYNSSIKSPPTTERAWNPVCFAFRVSYQSVIGTREGDSFRNRYTGATRASKSARFRVSVAVHIVQSSLVYSFRLSSGRP